MATDTACRVKLALPPKKTKRSIHVEFTEIVSLLVVCRSLFVDKGKLVSTFSQSLQCNKIRHRSSIEGNAALLWHLHCCVMRSKSGTDRKALGHGGKYGETVRRYSPLLSSSHMLHVAYGYLRIAIMYIYIYYTYYTYIYIYTLIYKYTYIYTLVHIYTLCKMHYILDILCIVYYILYLIYYIASYIMQL